jgi:hypothetical protein
MSKATLSFTLPEERAEHACAVHGAEWKSIVYELSMFLRETLKYGHKYKTADDALEAVKDRLWQECNASHLDPWGD